MNKLILVLYAVKYTCLNYLQAPLLMGCDVRNMSAETFELLSNKEAIAVNQGEAKTDVLYTILQNYFSGLSVERKKDNKNASAVFLADSLGVQGRKVQVSGLEGCRQIWAGPLSGCGMVVALWNRCSKATVIAATWESLGLSSSVSIRDILQINHMNRLIFGLTRFGFGSLSLAW